MSWTKLAYGGTGTPISLYVVMIPFGVPNQMPPPDIFMLPVAFLCVISSDGSLWAFNTNNDTWSKVATLPP